MLIESETTRELRLEFSILSMAGLDKTPWEIYACTWRAPFFFSKSAALTKKLNIEGKKGKGPGNSAMDKYGDQLKALLKNNSI